MGGSERGIRVRDQPHTSYVYPGRVPRSREGLRFEDRREGCSQNCTDKFCRPRPPDMPQSDGARVYVNTSETLGSRLCSLLVEWSGEEGQNANNAETSGRALDF